jgi:hypothetical protein
MDDSPKRVVARVMCREFLAIAGEMADRYGTDLIDTVIFTAVWTANTGHLLDGKTYATTFHLPPDSQRRPVSLEDLAKAVRLDPALVAERLAGMIGTNFVEKHPKGYVVPTAVFTQPQQLDGVELGYVRTLRLIQELDNYGIVDEARRLAPKRAG